MNMSSSNKNVWLRVAAQILTKDIRSFLTCITELDWRLPPGMKWQLIYDANYFEQLINSVISNWIELIGLLAWKVHYVYLSRVRPRYFA